MAEATIMSYPIDDNLRMVQADTTDLPRMEEKWSSLPRIVRTDWQMEWLDVIMPALEGLDRCYRSGEMTPEQRARYRSLLRQLKDNLPIIRRLELEEPTVSLDLETEAA